MIIALFLTGTQILPTMTQKCIFCAKNHHKSAIFTLENIAKALTQCIIDREVVIMAEIKRKAEDSINQWIKHPDRALLVTGARQVGKTYIIRKCLRDNGCSFIEINLIEKPELVSALEQATTIDDLKLNISALENVSFTDDETFLFIDEVQECKDIITKVKFWVDDGRIKLILSGSLLGVELRDLRSAPVGYMDELDMYPLDFEEFITASGVTSETVDYLRQCFHDRRPVTEVINNKMLTHLNRYLVVGGMPAAVRAYLETGNVNNISAIQDNIIRQYKVDFTKYETDDKKLMLTAIYDQIPSQLLKQNKRFNYADIQKRLRFEKLEDSFLWLKYAGVAIATVNVTEPRSALNMNEKSSLLKLYSSDVGLLTYQYGNALRSKILFGNDTVNMGGIFENFVVQELHAHGYPSYFYNSRKMGELDFVIEHNGAVLPIEVKSGKDYYVHTAINNVLSNQEYKIEEAFVFANCNVANKGKITYYPIYMCTFITDETEYPVLSLDI